MSVEHLDTLMARQDLPKFLFTPRPATRTDYSKIEEILEYHLSSRIDAGARRGNADARNNLHG
jgi:hypothetical protein